MTVVAAAPPVVNMGIVMNTSVSAERNQVVMNSVKWPVATPTASRTVGLRADGAYNPKTLEPDHSVGVFRMYDLSNASDAAKMGAFLTVAAKAVPDFSNLKSNLPEDAAGAKFMNNPKYQRMLAGMTPDDFILGGSVGEQKVVYKGNLNDVSPALRQVVEGLRALGTTWKPFNPNA